MKNSILKQCVSLLQAVGVYEQLQVAVIHLKLCCLLRQCLNLIYYLEVLPYLLFFCSGTGDCSLTHLDGASTKQALKDMIGSLEALAQNQDQRKR